MMHILPLNNLLESDQGIFGVNLFNLSKLARAGNFVPEGLAVAAPPILLETVLKHLETPSKEVFEQKLVIIKKQVSNIGIPGELLRELGKRDDFYLNGKFIKGKKSLWKMLLEIWLEEIRSRIWREGFTKGVSLNLTAQAVFFIKKPRMQKVFEAEGYFDPSLKEVLIKHSEGLKLKPVWLKQVDEQVLDFDKKLFLPQIYKFLIINEPKLVKVSPFTQLMPAALNPEIVLPPAPQKKLIKSAVKVFFNASYGFPEVDSLDGVLIEGECLPDFDAAVFRIAESALKHNNKPIIYKLPNIKDEDLQGSLRLINHKSLLDRSVETFLMARHKKGLLNVELGIPLVRSVNEFLQIKRELAARGVNRKGSLKFWLEACVPENLVNLEQYLEVDFDGLILDLDKMQEHLVGFQTHEGEFYKEEIKSLTGFLAPYFKVLHKAKIPVLALGQLTFHPDILNFLIENGVYGVVTNNAIQADSLPEHLAWSERRFLEKRLAV